MSLPEIGYRVRQYLQKQTERRKTINVVYDKVVYDKQDYHQILSASEKSNLPKLPFDLAKDFTEYNSFEFFGYSITINEFIDWHLDISSGKRFPLSFSKDIDIRSGRFGSAKIVWEINRLQFLLPLAIKYSLLKDANTLKLWMQLVESWVNSNPYLKGVNWYSNIEVNIRLIVWYYCWQVLWQNKELESNEDFTSFVKKVWLPSIYEHCVYSFKNPSKYSSANNHLIAEYSGLFIASCCWRFNETEKWKLYSLTGLEKEIKLQFTESGINKEQAAEYIQFITDFFLIPFAIGTNIGIHFSENYQKSLYNISEYIINLLDANKNYRKYGDEDDGKVLVVSNDPHFDNFSSILTSSAIIFNSERFKAFGNNFDLKNWLLWGDAGKAKYEKIRNTSVNLNSVFYKDDGHFIFRKSDVLNSKSEIYMHFDAAPLGFLSIAAHGHADALSVILTVDGYPLIVDVGTYTYHTNKEWRNYFVSTLAHNTICVDEINQAYQAGPTMWLNHYTTDVLKTQQSPSYEMVSAKHSGYKKIGCSHIRTIKFDREKELFDIEDQIDVDSREHCIIQPWHLHPDVKIESPGSHNFILQNKNGGRKISLKCDDDLQMNIVHGQTHPILGWYSKSFLIKEPTSVIIGKLKTTYSKKVLFNTSIQVVSI
jgi:hypothetical protein